MYVVHMYRRNDRAQMGAAPWVLRWRDPPGTGPQRRKQIGPMSERSAERHRQLWQCELNGFRADAHDGLTWRDFVRRVLASKAARLAPSSVAMLRQELARFGAAARPRLLGHISRPMIDAYQGRRIRATSEMTARKNIRTLRSALAWAVRMGYLQENPCDGLEWGRPVRTLPTALGLAATRRFLAALESEPTWLWASLRIAARWGPRTGELAAIRRADIDFRERLITLRATKTGRERCIPLDETSAGLLQELSHGRPGPLLWGPREAPFASADGKAGYRKRLVRAARRILSDLGERIPPQPIQMLRRTAETNLRRRGVDRYTVAQILGHSTRVGDAWYDARDPREFARSLEGSL